MSDALREAAQQALDALEILQGGCTDSGDGTVEAITVWCPEVIDALRAALAQPSPQAAPTVPEWLPIETAPKSVAQADGRIQAVYFLAYCPDPDATDLESCVCVCWWEPLMKKGKGQWFGEGMYPLHPTHWQPLPAAPQEPQR